jgi:exodeoxyribonuclease-3
VDRRRLPSPAVRLATWNVNGLRARLDRILFWLDQHDPDVLLLQETKVPDEAFPWLPFEERGLHVAAHGLTARNGVAIVSRSPVTDVVTGLKGDADDELADDLGGRLLRATTDGVRVGSAYAPNGRSVGTPFFAGKLRWFDRLARELGREHAGPVPVVLGGDLNVAPEDRDAWDPTLPGLGTHVGPDIRARWQALVDLGLTDALRAAEPDAEAGPFSWWDYRAGAFHRREGLRIDHVLLDARLAGRLERAYVDREARKGKQPSDHAPLVVELS